MPATVHWCGQCYAPVAELTPREPVHRGDFVDRIQGVEYRWSRWRRSATTFGPLGRVVSSVLVVGSLAWAFFSAFFVAWFCLLGIGVVVLRDIWQPARVLPARRVTELTTVSRKETSPSERETRTPLPTPVIVFRSVLALSGLAAIVAFNEGSIETKAVIVMTGTLIGMYAFLRGFLR